MSAQTPINRVGTMNIYGPYEDKPERCRKATGMALYIHLGCELDGSAKSNREIDRAIHNGPLAVRLKVMDRVFDL